MITYLIIPKQESRIDIDIFIEEIIDNLLEHDVNIIVLGEEDDDPELDETELRSVIQEVFDRWLGEES